MHASSLTKLQPHASLGWQPPLDGGGVTPQALTHQPLIGRLSVPVHLSQVIQGDAISGKEAAMHHQHLKHKGGRQAGVLIDLLITQRRDEIRQGS